MKKQDVMEKLDELGVSKYYVQEMTWKGGEPEYTITAYFEKENATGKGSSWNKAFAHFMIEVEEHLNVGGFEEVA